jgi:hypothetical protein
MFSLTLISSSLFFPPAAKKNQPGAAALSRALFALDISEHRAKLSGPLAGKAVQKNHPRIFPFLPKSPQESSHVRIVRHKVEY